MASVSLIVAGILGLTAITIGAIYSTSMIEENIYNKKNLLKKGIKENNTLWLYYDQSDVNSRWWADFGARSSRVLNVPFLNLCYQSIANNTSKHYNIRVLAGLSDVAVALGGWEHLPKSLQNPIAVVGEAELNYLRATILRRFGGLWVNPSTIFIKQLPNFCDENKKVILFGTNKDETYSDAKGTPAPGTDIMYSPKKDHPLFEYLEKVSRSRLDRNEGGKQFRRDINWDLRQVLHDFQDSIDYYPELEFARKADGRRIQLEDLLSTNIIPLNPTSLYAPVDWTELQERRNFGWFLRMSEDQILESDLLISKLFKLH